MFVGGIMYMGVFTVIYVIQISIMQGNITSLTNQMVRETRRS